MIKKTILSAFILLALYIGLTEIIKPRTQVSQHQWQDNSIKAENFIYNRDDSCESVIVGSSLSCRFVMDSLRNYRNLAFNGQSIFEGLHILNQRKNLPKNIFIEVNVLVRGEDKNFTDALYSPFVYRVRDICPALRDGNQPIARAGQPVSFLIQGLIEGIKCRLMASAMQGKPAPGGADKNVPSQKSDPQRNELLSRLVSIQAETYSKAPDARLLTQRLDDLYGYIEPLQKRHANIYFFEMPVNARLCDLPLTAAIREGLYSRFPPNKYIYIPRPDCADYQTTDGLHLDEKEAIRYTSYFKSKTSNLLAQWTK